MAYNSSSAPPSAPWEVGPQSVYSATAPSVQALYGLDTGMEFVKAQARLGEEERAKTLREWGRQREENMHRPPNWCMDQLVSGSGLFPPRLLSDDWFDPCELQQINQLERILGPTGHAPALARDVMALKMYGVDVRIIVDDSGSMTRSMFGSAPTGRGGWTRSDIQRVFGKRAFGPDNGYVFESCPMSPNSSRWEFAYDAVRQWEQVFDVLGIRPQYYLLNRGQSSMQSFRGGGGQRAPQSCSEIFSQGPGGGTPMGRTLQRVLQDIRAADGMGKQTHLILVLTDGEANDKALFNQTLDEIQDELYGDVQVCLLGLSLEPEDIEWFEDEECDDTRIRTIEAWEVEQQQILWRKVIGCPGQYSFAMHTMRALVTNLFPADYDCEAPLQTLRHRLYITLHAIDRRVTGRRDARYMPPLEDSCFACFSFILSGQASQRRRVFQEDELDDQLSDQRFTDLVVSARPTGIVLGDFAVRPVRPSLPSGTLREVQNAIACLQPGELTSRDLQYIDTNQNTQACSRALRHLYLAAGLTPLM